MIAHLALQCESVNALIKEHYLRILAGNDQSSEQSATKVTNK